EKMLKLKDLELRIIATMAPGLRVDRRGVDRGRAAGVPGVPMLQPASQDGPAEIKFGQLRHYWTVPSLAPTQLSRIAEAATFIEQLHFVRHIDAIDAEQG